jgi:predicted nucleotidyltransferase component of viral defense system
MKSALEQSIKEKIKALAKERESTFAELWRNLILERFLTRLAKSSYKEKFILKGGSLLAKYIHLGRETQDLDFFIQKLSNTEEALKKVLEAICSVEIKDSFSFHLVKISLLDRSQLTYTGAEITLQARFGATTTTMRMDLGFSDYVDPIEHLIELTSTPKGPLFESTISLSCYPKEFIFAEKLETIVFRGESNTRMKDFHDLYSLVHLSVLDRLQTKKAIELVFKHRKTSLKKLPASFEKEALKMMEKNWSSYRKKITPKKGALQLPESIEEIILVLNQWLVDNIF